MKLHVLTIAVALAAGSAFAAGSYDTQPAPPSKAGEVMHKAGAEARQLGSEVKAEARTLGDKAKHAVVKHREKHAVARHHEKHASAKHYEKHAAAKHHEKHASARHHETKHAAARHHGQQMVMRRDAHMMGAAAATPGTDLHAAARQRRIDDAYAHWLALPR